MQEIQYDSRTATRHHRTSRYRFHATAVQLGADMSFLSGYNTHILEYGLAVCYLICFVGFWKFTMGKN